eukprot:scaffold242862_cov23-Prasinocladus_malaysianus.AAC.1
MEVVKNEERVVKREGEGKGKTKVGGERFEEWGKRTLFSSLQMSSGTMVWGSSSAFGPLLRSGGLDRVPMARDGLTGGLRPHPAGLGDMEAFRLNLTVLCMTITSYTDIQRHHLLSAEQIQLS